MDRSSFYITTRDGKRLYESDIDARRNSQKPLSIMMWISILCSFVALFAIDFRGFGVLLWLVSGIVGLFCGIAGFSNNRSIQRFDREWDYSQRDAKENNGTRTG